MASANRMVFDSIIKYVNDYVSDVKDVYSELHGNLTHAKNIYNDETYKTESKKYVSSARNRLVTLYGVLKTSYDNFGRDELRKDISTFAMKPAKPEFLDSLRLYREFKLQMSRVELDALLPEAVLSYTGLRCLASVAAENHFSVSVPNIKDMEDDASRIDRYIQTAEKYVPEGYSSEADLIGCDHYTDWNGRVYGNGSVSRILIREGLEKFEQHANEIYERWYSTFVPSIAVIKIPDNASRQEVADALKDAETQKSEAVKSATANVQITDKRAIEFANEQGKREAEANEKYKTAMQHYKK